MMSPSRILSCSCVGLLVTFLQFHTVDASEPHFVDLNVDDTEPTFRFASETTISGNLRASTTTSSGERPSFPASHQKHRHLAKVADWRPWPDQYINNIEVIHNLCDDEWISAVERACQAWTDRSGAVGLRVKAAQCNKKVNDDLTFIPGKIHVVYGTCGSDCCGKVSQLIQLYFFLLPSFEMSWPRQTMVSYSHTCTFALAYDLLIPYRPTSSTAGEEMVPLPNIRPWSDSTQAASPEVG